MARTASVADLVEPTGIGTVNPGTRRAGILTLRIAAAVSVLALVVAVRPLNTAVQHAGAALHNWAGPLGDRVAHTHHAGPAIHLHTVRGGWLATGDRWPWSVGVATLVLLVWAGLGINKLRRPDPLAEAAGRRNLLGITAAVLVVFALVVVGCMQVEPGRAAVGVTLRGLAWFGGWLQHWTASLISTTPTPITRITGGTH